MKKTLTTLMICLAFGTTWACTNFLAGKNATVDGSTLISYAADSYKLYGFLKYQPAADHPAGTYREIYDWDTGKHLGRIPEVAHTYSVVGNMNEHQLTIGETTYGGREELHDSTGIMDYGSLIYVALQRCKTAREAISCIVERANTYGYCSDGESFSIGDPNEVWVMDLIGKGPDEKGIVWVARRVPDDCICAHANQARITTIDFRDKQNCLYAPDVIKFARKKGYFEGKDKDFSFCDAYNPLDFSGAYVCEARVWSFFRHLADDMDQYLPYVMGQNQDHMPLFVKPNRKVSAQDFKDLMRDQYEGTPLDITHAPAAGPWHSKLRYGSLGFKLDGKQYWWPRPTATQQTGWSFVAQMRGYATPQTGIFWFGVDDAATNVYVPMYSNITRVPQCFAEGNGDLLHYSETSAFWTFNAVANFAYSKYDAMGADIRRTQMEWENKFNEQVEQNDGKIRNMSAEEAGKWLTEYSCTQAEAVTAAWRKLGQYLLVKYLDGQQKPERDGRFDATPEGIPTKVLRPTYPEEDLRQYAPGVAHE